MNENRTFDLFKTFRTMGILVATTLALLLALAVGLAIEGERRLRPLQTDTEALSEAESQLLSLVNGNQATGVPPPMRSTDDELLDAIETLSQRIQVNLQDLETAQDTFLSLTHTAAGGIALLALLLGIMTLLFQRRILRPLHALSALLRRLAVRDYSPQSLLEIDRMLHPVFDSYNTLVNRLARLEQAHEQRHDEMERRVELAVGALVAQRAELGRAERFAAIGEMAAMLAHEIRNPLASIRAACGSLLEEADEPDTRERLDLVIQEVDRLIGIVGQQLDQARHKPEPVEHTDVAGLIEDTAKLVAYQLPDNVALDVKVTRPLETILPPQGLRRALLNLILNAKQAMAPAGGAIHVEARERQHNIVVRVTDDGPGFPEALLEHGVRHFFSTRGEGTGLGLSMVKRFVEQLSGRLHIENHGGGQVSLYIPIRQGASASEGGSALSPGGSSITPV
ncbi:MAG: two-component sensor histidine kinase [Chromatiaceae bacterium]|nr:two-component sensor histidine kinase [Chromatiaceae bacterium]